MFLIHDQVHSYENKKKVKILKYKFFKIYLKMIMNII